MTNKRFQTVIKQVNTPRFEIAVLGDKDDMYCIAYNTLDRENTYYSEQIRDFGMASMLFDMKYEEFIGN